MEFKMTLEPLSKKDLLLMNDCLYPDLKEAQRQTLLTASLQKSNNNRYFEIFKIEQNKKIIGLIQVTEKTDCVVTCNIEIVECERHKGYGFEALIAVLSLMCQKGYTIAVADIDEDNVAAVKLHEKLGFEKERTYRDQNTQKALYIRTLREFEELL